MSVVLPGCKKKNLDKDRTRKMSSLCTYRIVRVVVGRDRAVLASRNRDVALAVHFDPVYNSLVEATTERRQAGHLLVGASSDVLVGH